MKKLRAHGNGKGFTLLEMLLVMVIVSVIILMGTNYMQQKAQSLRIDRTAYQMQYILNAALAYYVANGTWPGASGSWYSVGGSSANPQKPITSILPSPLQATAATPGTPGYTGSIGYLANTPILDPWFSYGYFHGYNVDWMGIVPPNTFEVAVYMGNSTTQQAEANIIMGKLPFGYYDSGSGYLISYVNVPGQNLNNAMAVNFAGLYHHGACVPVPTCPNTTAGGGVTTSPQIFVVPVSVSGVNDPSSQNIYPISSFTAFATAVSVAGGDPPACNAADAVVPCLPISGNPPQTLQYWRVCMQVVTERGDVETTRTDAWGNDVTLAAFTRCAISDEPSGSTFSVYTH